MRRRRTREREVTSDWWTEKAARKQVAAMVIRATRSQILRVKVLSRTGLKRGLHTQGRKSSFMTERLEKERPACLSRRGRQAVWKP